MKRPQLTPINIINGFGAVIAIYLLVLLGQTVKHNYELNRQIDALKTQIETINSQKNELAYNIQYFQTDSFREREARAKLGLQAPGENVLSLPATTPVPTVTPLPEKSTKTKSNFRQWMDFLSGHSA